MGTNVRIDVNRMYRDRIRVTQSTNGQAMRGMLFRDTEISQVRAYVESLYRLMSKMPNARVKVQWDI